MDDAVKKFLYLYSIVSKLATEYNLLSDSSTYDGNTSTKSGSYGKAILDICSFGGIDQASVPGKIWTLQDITGTVDGSLGAALVEIGDSLTYPKSDWGILQATNVNTLCKNIGNSFSNATFGHPDLSNLRFLTVSNSDLLFYWADAITNKILGSITIPSNTFGTISLNSNDGIFQTKVDTICNLDIIGNYTRTFSHPNDIFLRFSLYDDNRFIAQMKLTNTFSSIVKDETTQPANYTSGDTFIIEDVTGHSALKVKHIDGSIDSIIVCNAGTFSGVTFGNGDVFTITNPSRSTDPIYLSQTTAACIIAPM